MPPQNLKLSDIALVSMYMGVTVCIAPFIGPFVYCSNIDNKYIRYPCKMLTSIWGLLSIPACVVGLLVGAIGFVGFTVCAYIPFEIYIRSKK